ncbi:M20 family metallo-hydrolase [Anaeromicrobium sediminis]|uniref:Peptidase M20 dimerisation domain-containing protein n=1 Tax=Anaeromicrobium sediminis TaxID=1478221 RepID=A0A267MJ13_9FIRM|nr:M20 family metallo-hydrolase [Anaeromicrobium sediminis]PAB59581.1 hypothetical protein CCE28_10250 [Anaeromicrobium sediminis]
MNRESFMSSFNEIFNHVNSIGKDDNGGITRLAYSEEEAQAKEYLKNYALELGLHASIDGVGNLWIRKEGTKPNLPSILVGSHLDTVPNGGRFDGSLGVILGIEILKDFAEGGFINTHPIEIIAFAAEESSRFNVSTIGSKILSNKLYMDDLKKIKDINNVSIYDAIIENGYTPENCKLIDPNEYKAFLEVHIEQNNILEEEGQKIGIVEAIAAPSRFKISLIGESAHSGACPMGARKDALAAAAEIILAIEHIGIKESIHKTVTTVGACKAFPGSMNVVPGKTEFLLDIRGIEKESIKRTIDQVLTTVKTISIKRDIQFLFEFLGNEIPSHMNSDINYLIETVCVDEKIPYRRMISGAGHDSMNMATIIPTSLIFIPCFKGISHNKEEFASDEDIYTSAKVLSSCLKKLSGEPNNTAEINA